MGIVLQEQVAHFCLPVINPCVIAVYANRPVHRAGTDAKDVLDFSHQIKWILAKVVDFIDECKNRDASVRANFEKFLCLRFDTFCNVDDHDSRVDGHQCTICIFREIRMPWRIQNIDSASCIVKLQYGTRYRNTALLFNFHPVRHCISGCFPCFYGACQVNSTPVKQKFFRQCRFTGIRM